MFRKGFSYVLRSRQGGVLIFGALYVAVSFCTRVALLVKSGGGAAWNASLPLAFLTGFAFDIAMALFFAVPAAVVLALVSERVFKSKTFRFCAHAWLVIALALFLFRSVSEWLFWDEFGVRFNFIAVDYLVYTTEVIRNIRQSYNMSEIFAGLAAATAAIWYALVRWGIPSAWLNSEEAAKGRLRGAGIAVTLVPVLAVTGTFYAVGFSDMRGEASFVEVMSAGLRHMGSAQPSLPNAYNSELARNGDYAFVAAFWGNELDYDSFYPGRKTDAAFLRLRGLLKQPGVTFVSDDAHSRDITRVIRHDGPEKKLNVIQITIESLSAEYLGCYGDTKYAPMNLTPNLDRLSKESVWFRHLYAGGTRTVRGMEALSLSIPPTPGQAILRRPHCENLFTTGGVFETRGYDRAFVYGGDGLFDNMNYFFANNGFRIVDQPAKKKSDPALKVAFANAWGASDEDLFDWVLADADKSFANGKPFYQFVMTTSNHRPYTWPAGRIDAKLRDREGGVAYTDYAIGKLLADAAKKPWFKDTVFVFVADHCASVAGKRELEVRKYEIPMFVYCPAHFPARRVDTLCSQIDYAPTLFGMMNWTYVSRFTGLDILLPTAGKPRAFISNYQKIAMIENDRMCVLKPVKASSAYKVDLSTGDLVRDKSDELLEDTIAWYECAAWMFTNRAMQTLSAKDERAILDKTR